MSAIAQNITAATTYAETKVNETRRSYKLYYRVENGEYIIASPGSDKPSGSTYEGRWVWNGARVQWISAHGTDQLTRLE